MSSPVLQHAVRAEATRHTHVLVFTHSPAWESKWKLSKLTRLRRWSATKLPLCTGSFLFNLAAADLSTDSFLSLRFTKVFGSCSPHNSLGEFLTLYFLSLLCQLSPSPQQSQNNGPQPRVHRSIILGNDTWKNNALDIFPVPAVPGPVLLRNLSFHDFQLSSGKQTLKDFGLLRTSYYEWQQLGIVARVAQASAWQTG